MSTSWTPTSSPSSPRVEAAPAPGRRSGAAAVWQWLGRAPFAATAELQERIRRDLLAGVGPETLLLCEHDPVITLGRAARAAHVLAPAAALAARGIGVERATRGGDVTYHGPGQLVGYPIVRLRGGVVGHVTAMARALAAVLAELGIQAEWRREAPGLWVRDGRVGEGELCSPEPIAGGTEPSQGSALHVGEGELCSPEPIAGGTEPSQGSALHVGEGELCSPEPVASSSKLVAFGVHVRRRVAIHGFALNVTTDVDAFDLIVPCGLRGGRVTSIARLGVAAPALPALAERVALALGRVLGVTFLPKCA
jgi:lipoyl(octanoyl) transferase